MRALVGAMIAMSIAACTIERRIPPSRFACENGGPCESDGGIEPRDFGPNPDPDLGLPPPEDTGIFPDALPDPPDTGPGDTGPPDTGLPDAGLPSPLCPTATALPVSGFISASNVMGGDDYAPPVDCADGQDPPTRDLTYWFAFPGRLSSLHLDTTNTEFDSVLYVYRDTCMDTVACADQGDALSGERLDLTDVDPGAYYVVVDGYTRIDTGIANLRINGLIREGELCDPGQSFLVCETGGCVPEGGAFRCRAPKDCADGIDNDGDLMIDENATGADMCVDPPEVTCPNDMNLPIGQTIALQATASDPDGTIVDRRWRLLSSPAPLLPPPFLTDARTATLTTTLAGEYVARHQVIDDRAQARACETRVTSAPTGDLRIELFWNPPLDPDGLDLDLHLINPQAANWFDGNDCEATNCQSGLEWGMAGSGTDNPRHDGNVRMGPGPESIRMQSPEVGGSYKVGVFYTEDPFGGFPSYPADAYVRIHCNRQLAATFGPVTLTHGALGDPTNDLWIVADLIFDAGGNCTVEDQSTMTGPLIITSMRAHSFRE